jgi:hypothetical protein
LCTPSTQMEYNSIYVLRVPRREIQIEEKNRKQLEHRLKRLEESSAGKESKGQKLQDNTTLQSEYETNRKLPDWTKVIVNNNPFVVIHQELYSTLDILVHDQTMRANCGEYLRKRTDRMIKSSSLPKHHKKAIKGHLNIKADVNSFTLFDREVVYVYEQYNSLCKKKL